MKRSLFLKGSAKDQITSFLWGPLGLVTPALLRNSSEGDYGPGAMSLSPTQSSCGRDYGVRLPTMLWQRLWDGGTSEETSGYPGGWEAEPVPGNSAKRKRDAGIRVWRAQGRRSPLFYNWPAAGVGVILPCFYLTEAGGLQINHFPFSLLEKSLVCYRVHPGYFL